VTVAVKRKVSEVAAAASGLSSSSALRPSTSAAANAPIKKKKKKSKKSKKNKKNKKNKKKRVETAQETRERKARSHVNYKARNAGASAPSHSLASRAQAQHEERLKNAKKDRAHDGPKFGGGADRTPAERIQAAAAAEILL
jgi:hypothetical protein